MSGILGTRHTRPLEREYEAWAVQGIEEYFRDLGLWAAVWAVSPRVEVTWPADEVLATGGKVVGLQFKQAKLAKKGIDFDSLNWTLAQPPAQFGRIQSRPEIYYCLPTFINRD